MSNKTKFSDAKAKFLEEATEIIELLDVDFSIFSTKPSSLDIIDKIMRSYHYLKVVAEEASFSFTSLFCHRIGNFFVYLQFNQIEITEALQQTLFNLQNRFKDLLFKSDDEETFNKKLGSLIDEVEQLFESLPLDAQKEAKNRIEFVADFIADSNEQLEALETLLMGAGSESLDAEAINTIFRAFHTLKSASSIMGLSPIEDLTHELENIITKVRDNGSSLSEETLNLFIEALKVLRSAVEDLRVGRGISFKRIKDFEHLLFASQKWRAPLVTESPEPIIQSKTDFHQKDLSLNLLQRSSLPVDLPLIKEETLAKKNLDLKNSDLIKISSERLEKLINIIGEVVIAESMVFRSSEKQVTIRDDHFLKSLNHLDKMTRQLHEVGLSLRMVPLHSLFQKIKKMAWDTSRKLGKKIEFVFSGEDTELDKLIVEKIGESLIHLVRNALDHGIETTSEERLQKGKSAMGRISVKASLRSGGVWIEIEDDGRGLNKQRILEKAHKLNLIGDQNSLHEREIYALICLPGFSTSEKVSELSGRGVGMDVVKRNIEEVQGTMDIQSAEGQGTKFILKIPNSLSIIDGMIVNVGEEHYVIPTQSIVRSMPYEEKIVYQHFPGQFEVVHLEEESFPLLRLDSYFGTKRETKGANTRTLVLIVEHEGQRMGLVVDDISRQQQFVVKALGSIDRDMKEFSGGTILPDGQVGLILDVASLVLELKKGIREQQEKAI